MIIIEVLRCALESNIGTTFTTSFLGWISFCVLSNKRKGFFRIYFLKD